MKKPNLDVCRKIPLFTATLWLLLSFVLGVTSSSAQEATVVFYNLAPSFGVDAPVFDDKGRPLEATNYLAMLYGGPAPEAISAIPPAEAFRTNRAGYFGNPQNSQRRIPERKERGRFLLLTNLDSGIASFPCRAS
jgi:hypothetical protein